MKKLIGMIVIVGLAVFIGCGDKKKSNPTGPGVTHNGTIHATVSGDYNLTFNCSTAYGLSGTGNASEGTSGSMHIQGAVTIGSDTYMIDIQVYHDPATGTYNLTFPYEADGGVGTISKNSTGNFSKSGTVTLTQATSSQLAGTFSFVAFRMESDGGTGVVEKTVNVASGTFDVPVILSN